MGDPELVIVDEPTAGLDPSERRRFQCMLCEAAQNCVLILSSHIVEDIAGLCEQMALMDKGKLVLTGDPQQLVRKLDGKVWEIETELNELEAWRRQQRVLAWRPHRNKLIVRLWADERPNVGDQVQILQAEPDLEDLYALHIGQEN